jgi:thymidylate kinase
MNEIENGNNIILDRYAYSGVAYSSAKVFNIE